MKKSNNSTLQRKSCHALWSLVGLIAGWSPSAANAADDQTLKGGPWDGLIVGDVVTPAGLHEVALKPSLANSSPTPVKYIAAVNAVISVYLGGDAHTLKAFVSSGTRFEVCKDHEFMSCKKHLNLAERPFSEPCLANTPYYQVLPNGDPSIRIEWTYNGLLYYLSWVKFEGKKIAEVKTVIAYVPPVLSPLSGR